MQKALLLFILLIIVNTVFSQDTVRLKEISKRNFIVTDRPPQAVYFQLGGSAPIMSVNYDRRFGKRVNGLGFSAGIGYWGFNDFGSTVSVFSVPVSINYLFGRRSDFLEVAAGTTYISARSEVFDYSDEGSGFIHHINIGYRHQPATGGFFFRGGYSPMFAEQTFQSWFYLGFGYNF